MHFFIYLFYLVTQLHSALCDLWVILYYLYIYNISKIFHSFSKNSIITKKIREIFSFKKYEIRAMSFLRELFS